MTTAPPTVRRLAALNLALMIGFPLMIAGAVAHLHGLVIAGAVLVGLLALHMIVLAPVALARNARTEPR
jgi:Zn-dependent membrane protease YugP